MTKTQAQLLACISRELLQQPQDIQITAEMIEESEKQAVFSLLPLDEDDRWLHLLSQNMRSTYEHQWLHELLSSNDVSYCMLKGIVSASYYPDPDRRTMGDVDFIVYPEDMVRVSSLLEAQGYTRINEVHDHHVPFQKEQSILEMHWELSGMPADQPRLKELMANLIDKASLKNGCMQPSAFHHGLILLMHTAEHMLNTGIGLRHLCDWAVFCNSFANSAFTDLFEKKLKETGMWRFAQLLALTSVKYLSVPYQSWMGAADDTLLRDLMDDILASGNFGTKDPSRINEAKLMTDRHSRTVKRNSMIGQLFSTLTWKAYLEWPVCEKHKILLPIGWAYISLRHLQRIKYGTRPQINLKSTIAGAKRRRDIYEEFRLFQP